MIFADKHPNFTSINKETALVGAFSKHYEISQRFVDISNSRPRPAPHQPIYLHLNHQYPDLHLNAFSSLTAAAASCLQNIFCTPKASSGHQGLYCVLCVLLPSTSDNLVYIEHLPFNHLLYSSSTDF